MMMKFRTLVFSLIILFYGGDHAHSSCHGHNPDPSETNRPVDTVKNNSTVVGVSKKYAISADKMVNYLNKSFSTAHYNPSPPKLPDTFGPRPCRSVSVSEYSNVKFAFEQVCSGNIDVLISDNLDRYSSTCRNDLLTLSIGKTGSFTVNLVMNLDNLAENAAVLAVAFELLSERAYETDGYFSRSNLKPISIHYRDVNRSIFIDKVQSIINNSIR